MNTRILNRCMMMLVVLTFLSSCGAYVHTRSPYGQWKYQALGPGFITVGPIVLNRYWERTMYIDIFSDNTFMMRTYDFQAKMGAGYRKMGEGAIAIDGNIVTLTFTEPSIMIDDTLQPQKLRELKGVLQDGYLTIGSHRYKFSRIP